MYYIDLFFIEFRKTKLCYLLALPCSLVSQPLHQLSDDQLNTLHVLLLLVIKNRLWLAVSVQNVRFVEVRADKSSKLNFGKIAAGALPAAGEWAVAAAVEDHMEDGKEEAKGWDSEKEEAEIEV